MAPVFKCPLRDQTIRVKSDPGKATAKISLPQVSYTDNSEAFGGKLFFSAFLDGKPITVDKEVELSIDHITHSVRYIVKDEAGNTAYCDMYYSVEGKI